MSRSTETGSRATGTGSSATNDVTDDVSNLAVNRYIFATFVIGSLSFERSSAKNGDKSKRDRRHMECSVAICDTDSMCWILYAILADGRHVTERRRRRDAAETAHVVWNFSTLRLQLRAAVGENADGNCRRNCSRTFRGRVRSLQNVSRHSKRVVAGDHCAGRQRMLSGDRYCVGGTALLLRQ